MQRLPPERPGKKPGVQATLFSANAPEGSGTAATTGRTTADRHASEDGRPVGPDSPLEQTETAQPRYAEASNPFVAAGVALVLGVLLAKWVDRRARGRAQR